MRPEPGGRSQSGRRRRRRPGIHRLMLAVGGPLAIAAAALALHLGLADRPGEDRGPGSEGLVRGLYPQLSDAIAHRFDPTGVPAREADAALCRGDLGEAIRLYEDAGRADPADRWAPFVRAGLLADQGRMAEAREITRRLAAAEPGLGQIRHLARLLERAGDRRPTLEQFQETLEEIVTAPRPRLEFGTLARILHNRLYRWTEQADASARAAPHGRFLAIRLLTGVGLEDETLEPLSVIDRTGDEILDLVAYAGLGLARETPLEADLLEALDRWRELEPDNAAPDYLLAAALDRWIDEAGLTGDSREDDSRFATSPSVDRGLPEAATEALLRAAGKPSFAPHTTDLWEAAAAALEEGGDLFAPFHLGSPDRALMGVHGRQLVDLMERLHGDAPAPLTSWLPIGIDLLERVQQEASSPITRRVLAALVSRLASTGASLPTGLAALGREAQLPSAGERLTLALARRGLRGALRVPLPIPSIARLWARAWVLDERGLTRRFLSLLGG